MRAARLRLPFRPFEGGGDRAIVPLMFALPAAVIRLANTAAMATMAMARALERMAVAMAAMMARQTQCCDIAQIIRFSDVFIACAAW